MNKDIPISEKRGCHKDSLNLILVKDSVDSISRIFTDFFELQVYSNGNIKQYLQLEEDARSERIELQSMWSKAPIDKRKKIATKLRDLVVLYPILVWRYYNHEWSILLISGDNDQIAFVLSTLLETDVITFWESKRVCFSEFKLFRKDELVEHYNFGLECGKLYEKYWDLIVECESDPELFTGVEAEEHKFCSSIRQIRKEEIKLAVDNKRKFLCDRGYLDTCLRYYDAYLPDYEETPLDYSISSLQNDLDIQNLHNAIEQMDIIMMTNNWSYYDSKVPQQVTKD